MMCLCLMSSNYLFMLTVSHQVDSSSDLPLCFDIWYESSWFWIHGPYVQSNNAYGLPETNIAGSEIRPKPKRKPIVFQLSIFRFYVGFREGSTSDFKVSHGFPRIWITPLTCFAITFSQPGFFWGQRLLEGKFGWSRWRGGHHTPRSQILGVHSHNFLKSMLLSCLKNVF